MPLDGPTIAALWAEVNDTRRALHAASTPDNAAAAQQLLNRLLKAEHELDFGDESAQPPALIHQNQRVGVLLPLRIETRFRRPGANWIVQVRLFPEPIAFDQRPRPAPGQTRTAQVEAGALRDFWTSAGGQIASAAAPAAFRVLADTVGAARAAWLVRHVAVTMTATGAEVDPVAPPAPALAALPPRLGVWLARGGGDPVLAMTLTVDAVEIAEQSTIERLASTGASFDGFWWNDFQTAKDVGLACEIVLGPTADIDVLIVAGVGDMSAAELFGAHSEAGSLGLLAPGTATSTVDGAPTVPLELSADSWFDLVRRIGWTQAGTRQAAMYLTGKPTSLPALPGGDVDVRATPQRVAGLLMPGIFGRALHDQWSLGIDGHATARWATRWLLPGGPCPVIRVGDIPYGVLPVASRSDRWISASDEPTVETGIIRHAEIAAGLAASVAEAAGTAAGANAERVLQLLTTTPVSPGWLARPAMPLPLVAIGTAGALSAGGVIDAELMFEDAARQAVNAGLAPSVPIVAIGDAIPIPRDQVDRRTLRLGSLAQLAFEPWSGHDDVTDRHKQTYTGEALFGIVRRREGKRHLVEYLIDASMVLTHVRLVAVLSGGDGSINLVDANDLVSRLPPLVSPADRQTAEAGGPLGAEIARVVRREVRA